MHPLKITTEKQHYTHIFLVTHWGASASKKPGPDNSRNTPLNRHIRSCQFDQQKSPINFHPSSICFLGVLKTSTEPVKQLRYVVQTK